jgi:cysteine synthase A
MRAYGAKLVLTPGGESDVDLCLTKVEEMKRENPGKFWEAAQFSNRDNIEAHYLTTGPEIWEQTDGKVDVFVASQGSGGTITGVGRYLKEKNTNVKVYAVEPAECPVLSGGGWGPHMIEGIGDGFIPENLDLDYLDGVVTVSSQDAIDMARRLAQEEGVLCGISSGCNVVAANKLSRELPDTKVIVTMINDTGMRYFSTPLFGQQAAGEIPERVHPIREEDRQKLAAANLRIVH